MQDIESKYYKKLGAFLRHARKSQKLSLKYVADQTGITFQQLQKYECGENRITKYRQIQKDQAIKEPLTEIIYKNTEN